MNWLLYSLVAVLFTVTYSLVSKKILNQKENFDPIAYALVLFFVVALYSFAAYFMHPAQKVLLQDLVRPQFLLYFLPVCLIYAAAPAIYYRALKHLPISEVTILYSLVGIYALVLGVLIGSEQLLLIHVLGAICVLASTLLVVFRKQKIKTGRYFWMLILATLLYAVGTMIDNRIISTHYIDSTLYQALIFFVPSLLLLVFSPRSHKDMIRIMNNKTVLVKIIINGLVFFGSFFFIFKAYASGGYASQVNLVVSTETIATVFFAALFLNECQNLKIKLAAACVATFGIWLLR